MLIEEVKKCLPKEVKTYIDERGVETLNQAAVIADDYNTMTHKMSVEQQFPSFVYSYTIKVVEPSYPPNDDQRQNHPRGSAGMLKFLEGL